jgi:hypothetical protein
MFVQGKKVKSLIVLAAIAAVTAVAAPASAQTLPSYLAPITYNVSAGYTGISWSGQNLGAVTLRAGADFGKYVGVEGEGSFGVTDANTAVHGYNGKLHLNDQFAGYGVVRYPVLPNANLFARVGYGHSDIKATMSWAPTANYGEDSLNYGVGGQYFFNPNDGLRVEWTRYDFQSHGMLPADTWSLSYVRKF